jgi:hypothetical protein
MNSDQKNQLQLDTIRFSPDGVAEMDGARQIVFVPRADILRIEVAHGSGAEQPIVVAVLGIGLILLAVLPLLILAWEVVAGAMIHTKFVTAVAFVIPGVWLLGLAFRKRWYLLVHMRKGTRKLLFGKAIDSTAVSSFLGQARAQFGYL